jgi:hypothetical protein
MPNFWTPRIQEEFHQALEALRRVTEQPLGETLYRDAQSVDRSTDPHQLQFEHERQIADHIAYLAHSKESVEAISAACVEKHDEQLVIRLASNHTPSEATLSGLGKLLETIRVGAAESK